MKAWMLDGKVLVDALGRVIDCPECPCDGDGSGSGEGSGDGSGSGSGGGPPDPVVVGCCEGASIPGRFLVAIDLDHGANGSVDYSVDLVCDYDAALSFTDPTFGFPITGAWTGTADCNGVSLTFRFWCARPGVSLPSGEWGVEMFCNGVSQFYGNSPYMTCTPSFSIGGGTVATMNCCGSNVSTIVTFAGVPA